MTRITSVFRYIMSIIIILERNVNQILKGIDYCKRIFCNLQFVWSLTKFLLFLNKSLKQ